jgi:hypothetical protein
MTFFGTLSSISTITLPGLISGTATQLLASPYIRMDNVLVFKSLRFIIQTSCQIAFSQDMPNIPIRLAIIAPPQHTKIQMHLMHFNGSYISVSADGYTLDIAEPLSRKQSIALDDVRSTSPLLPASAAKFKSIRSLAGSLNFIGQAACPPATFVSSAIQQRLGTDITVATALQANAMLKELRRIPSLLFFPFAKAFTHLRIIDRSDASFMLNVGV